MAQSIQTSKFGTLDTSGRVPVYFAGIEGDAAPLNMGLSFDVGGKSYVFIPEDRITKGATSGDQGRAYVGFLNPDLLFSLKNNSEYIDIAGSQFGSFDAGKFISDQMGGSTKGYLTTTEVATPIINAGVSEFNPQLTGQLKGIGSYQGQPVYYGDKGYIEPSGRYHYQVTTGQKIVGYKYSSGGGLLAGLGNEILKAGPILPLALDVVGAAYGLPGIGTAIAGGVTAGAIASGDEKTAANYAGQVIAGQIGVGSAVAGATGSTVAGQVAQGTAGGLLAGKNPEQAVTSAVQNIALDSLRPDSGVTVPTEAQVAVGQQDLMNQLADFEVDTTASAFDTNNIIDDSSGFSTTTQTTGNTGVTTMDEDFEGAGMSAGLNEYLADPEGAGMFADIQRELNLDPEGAAMSAGLSQAIQDYSTGTGLKIKDVVKFFKANPNLAKAATSVISGGVGLFGTKLATDTATAAAKAAADAMKFKPVGVTTRFGTTDYTYDAEGNLKTAGYTLTPELKAIQDKLMSGATLSLDEAKKVADLYDPLKKASSSLFDLGTSYLAKTPEQVAADYMAKQQDLLAPSRERQMSQLQNTLFQQGRGGLSVGATSARPSGARGLGATTPEMEAYYNALAQQDAALAAGAQQAGQQSVLFGKGLLGAGGEFLGKYTAGQTSAYDPFKTLLSTAGAVEGMGAGALQTGAELGGRTTTASSNAARTLLPTSSVNPYSSLFTSLADDPQFKAAVQSFLTGG